MDDEYSVRKIPVSQFVRVTCMKNYVTSPRIERIQPTRYVCVCTYEKRVNLVYQEAAPVRIEGWNYVVCVYISKGRIRKGWYPLDHRPTGRPAMIILIECPFRLLRDISSTTWRASDRHKIGGGGGGMPVKNWHVYIIK